MDKIIRAYEFKKNKIKDRLQEFKQILDQKDERIFAELAFCICTPQSKATTCWQVILKLMENELLFKGDEKQIRPLLNCIRFGDNKTRYIIRAREFFTDKDVLKIKEKIFAFNDVFRLRDWLYKNVLGLGMKEASHFLRNIGLGQDLAILDRHIMRNLKNHHIIDQIPKSLTQKVYVNIENRMREFARIIKIPMDELDLLFWSEETGTVFK